MICRPQDRAEIHVVDANPSDYSSLARGMGTQNRQFVFFRTGRDALRSIAVTEPMMWVVNMQLPDMFGTDLQALLRQRGCTSPIVLVGDEYRPEDEISARASGAALYFAKPIRSEMLRTSC